MPVNRGELPPNPLKPGPFYLRVPRRVGEFDSPPRLGGLIGRELLLKRTGARPLPAGRIPRSVYGRGYHENKLFDPATRVRHGLCPLSARQVGVRRCPLPVSANPLGGSTETFQRRSSIGLGRVAPRPVHPSQPLLAENRSALARELITRKPISNSLKSPAACRAVIRFASFVRDRTHEILHDANDAKRRDSRRVKSKGCAGITTDHVPLPYL